MTFVLVERFVEVMHHAIPDLALVYTTTDMDR
jgi:hypothetical protein